MLEVAPGIGLKLTAPVGMDCHWYATCVPPATTWKVADWPTTTERFCGCCEMLTGVGGTKVMLELECCVPSAMLVAVTTTVWLLGIVAGAVYKPPLEMVPTFGLSDQFTCWFTVNCWV